MTKSTRRPRSTTATTERPTMPADTTTVTATHDGVLVLPGGAVRCAVAQGGAAFLSTKGIVRVITGEVMTTWSAFVRTVPELALDVGGTQVVRVRPRRGPVIEAVSAVVLPRLCRLVLEAVARGPEPTAEQTRVAQRCAAVMEVLNARGEAALGPRGAQGGAACTTARSLSRC